jgi:ATP-dependent DNA ligase
MTLRDKLPAGFVVPAQPVEREAPPTGADWVHEIKHDGYRMLVRRDGGHVRLYSRKAIDWTDRLPAIAAGAALLKAKSFTIDGEAVVIRSDGLTDFEALRRREVPVTWRCSTLSTLSSWTAPICAACRSRPGRQPSRPFSVSPVRSG